VDGAKRTLGEVTDDAQITAVVKVRLLNDPEVKGLRINVTT
jgi:osmotically-inducible protein OsmY